LEGKRAFDPQRLREQLQKEVTRVAQLGRDRALLRSPPAFFRMRRPASRSDSAMITSAGLADPWVGRTLPSAMNRFGTPQARWPASTTLSSAPKPILQPPTRCANRSIFSWSWAPAPSQISCTIFVATLLFALWLAQQLWL